MWVIIYEYIDELFYCLLNDHYLQNRYGADIDDIEVYELYQDRLFYVKFRNFCLSFFQEENECYGTLGLLISQDSKSFYGSLYEYCYQFHKMYFCFHREKDLSVLETTHRSFFSFSFYYYLRSFFLENNFVFIIFDNKRCANSLSIFSWFQPEFGLFKKHKVLFESFSDTYLTFVDRQANVYWEKNHEIWLKKSFYCKIVNFFSHYSDVQRYCNNDQKCEKSLTLISLLGFAEPPEELFFWTLLKDFFFYYRKCEFLNSFKLLILGPDPEPTPIRLNVYLSKFIKGIYPFFVNKFFFLENYLMEHEKIASLISYVIAGVIYYYFDWFFIEVPVLNPTFADKFDTYCKIHMLVLLDYYSRWLEMYLHSDRERFFKNVFLPVWGSIREPYFSIIINFFPTCEKICDIIYKFIDSTAPKDIFQIPFTKVPPVNRLYDVVPFVSLIDNFYPERELYREEGTFIPLHYKAPTTFKDPFCKLREFYEAELKYTNAQRFYTLRNYSDIAFSYSDKDDFEKLFCVWRDVLDQNPDLMIYPNIRQPRPSIDYRHLAIWYSFVLPELFEENALDTKDSEDSRLYWKYLCSLFGVCSSISSEELTRLKMENKNGFFPENCFVVLWRMPFFDVIYSYFFGQNYLEIFENDPQIENKIVSKESFFSSIFFYNSIFLEEFFFFSRQILIFLYAQKVFNEEFDNLLASDLGFFYGLKLIRFVPRELCITSSFFFESCRGFVNFLISIPSERVETEKRNGFLQDFFNFFNFSKQDLSLKTEFSLLFAEDWEDEDEEEIIDPADAFMLSIDDEDEEEFEDVIDDNFENLFDKNKTNDWDYLFCSFLLPNEYWKAIYDPLPIKEYYKSIYGPKSIAIDLTHLFDGFLILYDNFILYCWEDFEEEEYDPTDDENYPEQYIDEEENIYVIADDDFDHAGPFGRFESDTWEWLWFDSDCYFLDQEMLFDIILENYNYPEIYEEDGTLDIPGMKFDDVYLTPNEIFELYTFNEKNLKSLPELMEQDIESFKEDYPEEFDEIAYRKNFSELKRVYRKTNHFYYFFPEEKNKSWFSFQKKKVDVEEDFNQTKAFIFDENANSYSDWNSEDFYGTSDNDNDSYSWRSNEDFGGSSSEDSYNNSSNEEDTFDSSTYIEEFGSDDDDEK